MKAVRGLGIMGLVWLTGCKLLAIPTHEVDVVVYGGTSAGVVAAIQASKMGRSVLLVCPDLHLGGLSSGGLGYTDSGNTKAVGGMAREFYQRVYQHYTADQAWRWQKKSDFSNEKQGRHARVDSEQTMWTFEPHVAENIFNGWLAEHNVPVYRNEWLDREKGVVKQSGRIVSVTMLSGKTFKAKVFIDATYEGDLMAAAGVSYHVGREASSVYGEVYNGIQFEGIKQHRHYFMSETSPYKIPGDPKSGVLPYISTEPPGKNGEGDRRVQAYCYRTCLTKHAPNRVPFPKPEGYDPANYELLLRDLLTGRKDFFEKFDLIPNLKTDTNNHGAFSSDFIGMNYDYPNASYARRREILQAHENYQKGYYYFVLDSHNCQRYINADGFVQNEGDVGVAAKSPYRISYGSIVPKKAECQNLLVPVCLSSSHIVFGSIRMEPVFMILGQSAATAAAQAIDEGKAVQEIDYPCLSERLLTDKQRF